MSPALQTLSASERDFIWRSVEGDCRVDGRARMDLRQYTFETGLLPQANGSARVRLAFDGEPDAADVVAAIKVEIGEPLSDRPDEGRVVCHVECSSGASTDFEGRSTEDVGMGQLLERVLNQRGVLDLGRMCIVPRRTCWVLHVDVVVLGFGGNVTDAMFMAVRAALHNTRIPQLVIDPSVGTGDGPGANGSAAEYELLADEQAMVRLDIGCVPLCVTLSKIADRHIVDARSEEEACSEARLHCAIDASGRVVMLQKEGGGSMAPTLMTAMIQTAKRVALGLLKQQDVALRDDESRPVVGFFA